jgi:Fungal chitosanase of glycosyl hydrolase group 75
MFVVRCVPPITAILLAATLQTAAAPVIPSGTPIDEQYRQKFATCDSSDSFDGVHFPISRNGKVVWYGCRTDPSRFLRFDRVPGTRDVPEAVIIVSKLGHDEDGSWKACHHQGGPTDQCTTSLMLTPTPQHPCPPITGFGHACLPLDPDAVAYVVIPHRAPPGIETGAFTRLSRVRVGDYGVVIANARVVPVIIGDTGPAYKIGEGSTALLSALSQDGRPHTIAQGVTFILFVGSREAVSALDPDTLPARIREKAMALYGHFTAQ